ncbi:N2227-like protein-domain-containing protein [Mycena metata]|uniref:N2227-like protein-domain-containing protein n=1 Tax=Mycena metata TaxID=1033252 RepID=A0AAD7I812_9AGAR|nr:N2227-like protein-domain-containing protein [Mycena metata]
MPTTIPWTSDVWLALFLPFAIGFAGWRFSSSLSFPRTWSEVRDLVSLKSLDPSESRPFSLERAHNTYARYRNLSVAEASHLQVSYTSIGRAHKRLGYTLGYPAKLDKLAAVTNANAKITDAIAKLAEKEFDIDVPPRGGTSMDLMRVREALKHFIRDWSSDGLRERDKIFAPILNVLRTVDADERANQRVLVPGSGLGRLAWEISELGFHETTANELSFFMTLALRFLFEPSTTSAVDQHLIHPYAHWFSHQRSADSLFRSISFPDAIPRLSPRFKLVEKDFLTLRPPPAVNPLLPPITGYDYIVTLFFIDTSLNILTTLEHIYSLLRPGGTWINLGPLLWTSGGQAKLELTLEEVLRAAEEIGFVIDPREDGQQSQTVECEYTGDAQAMMRWIYRAEFWVAHKPK